MRLGRSRLSFADDVRDGETKASEFLSPFFFSFFSCFLFLFGGIVSFSLGSSQRFVESI